METENEKYERGINAVTPYYTSPKGRTYTFTQYFCVNSALNQILRMEKYLELSQRVPHHLWKPILDKIYCECEKIHIGKNRGLKGRFLHHSNNYFISIEVLSIERVIVRVKLDKLDFNPYPNIEYYYDSVEYHISGILI